MFRSALGTTLTSLPSICCKAARQTLRPNLVRFLLRGATVTKEDVVTAANLQKFVDYFGPFDCPAMISRVSSLSS
jgi:hypothetical protein